MREILITRKICEFNLRTSAGKYFSLNHPIKLWFLLWFCPLINASAADTTLMRAHFNAIIGTPEPRNFMNIESLNQVATYIYDQFNLYGDSTVYQDFQIDGNYYKNVITSFGPRTGKRIIVGAHYDVCGEQDGADDNASGIVALLEFARMLDTVINLKYRVDLVAYSLEEPPYFGTKGMGSYIHARYLNQNNIPVLGMICMDMIGYYSDEKKSQAYPLGILKLIYSGKGDYITVVRCFKGGKFAREVKHEMKNTKEEIEVKSFKGPKKLIGIGFSDHLNYWRFDYSAVFITNTGFFRNPNYHKSGDKLETLDFAKMGETIDALAETIQEIE